MKESVRLQIVKALIPCFSLLLFLSVFSEINAQSVTGKVFKDFNANGVKDNSATYNEVGQAGVVVKAYNSSGVEVGSAISASDGSYTISPVLGDLRIEFSSIPSTSFSSPKGTGSKTSVQFVTTPATNVNLGINDPDSYWDSSTDPRYVVPCYLNGLSSGNLSTGAGVVSTPYSSTGLNAGYTDANTIPVQGTGPIPQKDASISVVGTVWGEAYYKAQKHMYFSTFLKRNSGMADGPGYIYNFDYSNPASPSLTGKFNLQGVTPTNGGVTIDLGSVTRTGGTDYTLPATNTLPSVDLDAFAKVAAISFGDIDMQPNTGNLWAVNCFQKALIRIDVSGNPTSVPTKVDQYILSSLPGYPTSTKGILRPWALKFHAGSAYLGVIDDATNTGATDVDLKAYVLKFDPNNILAGFTVVLSFDPNLKRPLTTAPNSALLKFHRWLNVYTEPPVTNPNGTTGTGRLYPQPVFSDIEIDENDNMYLSFFDRFAHQIGGNNYKPLSGSTTLISTSGIGEILKACANGTGWNIEGTGTCATSNEFFQDVAGDTQIESSEGALALLKGKNQILQISVDPHPQGATGQTYWNTQGMNTYDLTTGEISNWYSVYRSNTALLGKANGLGDIEFLLGVQPIEVGNRLWNDTNKNGIQDAGEPVLTGVTVELWKNGSKISTTTTDLTTGEYFFTGLTPNSTDYEIRIPNVNGASKQTKLNGLTPTTANASANAKDGIDSDAIVTGANTYAAIPFSTGNAGENNHNLDAGFSCIPPIAKINGQNVAICDPISIFVGLTAASASETWAVVTTPTNPAVATINSTTGAVAGMTVNGTYRFVLSNTQGCTDTVSITRNPIPMAGGDQTVCSPSTKTIVPTATSGQVWSVITKPVGTTPIFVATGSVTEITGLTANGVYTLRITQGDCFDEIQVTRKASPNAGTDQSVCGTTAELGDQGLNTWAVVASPVNPATAIIDAFGSISEMTVVGKYRFVLSSTNGCSDTVVVDKKLEANITTADINTCLGGNANFTASSTIPGATYFWSGPVSFTSTQQNPSIANISNDRTGNYTVTVTSPNGCTASAVSKVGLTNIAVSLIAGKTSYCVGENIVLRTLTPEVGYVYDWTGPNGFSSMNTLNVTIPTTPSKVQQGVYSVTITDPNACSAISTINITVTECLSIGNLVWNDANNDGLNNNSEVGVGGVPVRLYKATLDGGGNPTDVPSGVSIATTTTSTAVGSIGKYLFSGLIPGYYIVEIDAPAGYKTSTGTNGSTTGTYEPALNPNNDGNDNDDGTNATAQIIRSKAIELGNYTEPTGDGDITTGDNTDKNSNLTIDFGIYQPAKIGAFVWEDTNKDGIQDVTETTGVANVIVKLYLGSSTTPVATFTTLGDGKYLFDNLIPGTYTVEFVKTSIGAGSNFSPLTGTTDLTKDSNADPATGKSTPITLVAGESNLTIDAGISRDCPGSAVGTITITAPNLCVGQTLKMSATSSDQLATYSWSKSPAGFTATTQEVTLSNLVVANSGTYTVLITNSNACTSTLTANVVVNPLPTLTVSQTTVCAGATGILTVSGASSYSWTGPNSFTTTGTSIGVTQAGVYTVTGTLNGCSAIATTSLTINPSPTLTATGASICLGGSGTVSVLPAGLTYAWTGPNNFSSTQQMASITGATTLNQGTYTVKVTDTKGCTANATVAVTVGASLTVTPTSSSPVCLGSRLDLSIEGGAGAKYLWTSPAGVTSTLQNPFTNVSTLTDAGVWTVSVENVDGCKGIGTTMVVINTKLNGGNDISICEPITTAQLPLISGGTWTSEATNSVGVTINNTSGLVSGLNSNGTYVFIVSNTGGCKDTVNLYRNPKLDAGSDKVICSPSSTVKLLATSTGQTWRYFANGSTLPIPTVSSGGNVAGITQDGTYLFILEQTGGTIYCADTVAVIRKPAPNAGTDQTGNSGICEPQTTAKLQAAGSNQTWSIASNSAGIGTVAIDATGAITKMNTNGTYIFVLTQGDCSDSVKVERKARPNAGLDAMFCADSTKYKLPNAPNNMVWSSVPGNPSGTQISGATGEIIGMTVVGDYTFVLSNLAGCSDTVKVTRKAIPAFVVITIIATCTIGTANPNAQLVVAGFDIANRYDFSEGTTYTGTKTYATATANSTIPTSGIIASNLVNPTIEKNYTVRMFNANGCFTDKTVKLIERDCLCKPDLCLPYLIKKVK